MRLRCSRKGCPPWRLLLTAVGLTVVTYFPAGYHHSVMNVAHDIFQSMINESYTKRYSADERLTGPKLAFLWSMMVSSWQIGAVFGSINAFWLADRLGRKSTLTLLTGTIHLAGSTCMVLSVHFQYFELLIIGRLLSGMSTGVICIVLRLFIGECSPDRNRGTLNCLCGLVFTLAILIAMSLGLPEVLGDGTRLKVGLLLGFCLPFNIVQVLLFPFIPETPKYLYLTKNDKTKAEASIAHYHGKKADAEVVFLDLEEERKFAGAQLSFCQALRLKSVRLPLILALVAGICDSSTGIDIADNYSAGIFTQLGMPSWEAKLSSIVINIVGLAGAALSVLIINRFSRCKLLLTTLVLCVVANFAVVILGGIAKFALNAQQPKLGLGIATAAMFGVIQCAYGAGPGAILEPLFAEVSPHRVRAVAGSISKVSSSAAKWLYLFVYPIIDEYAGAMAFLIHTVPLIGCIVYFFYCLPETGKQSVAHILDTMTHMHGSKESAAETVKEANGSLPDQSASIDTEGTKGTVTNGKEQPAIVADTNATTDAGSDQMDAAVGQHEEDLRSQTGEADEAES